MRILIPVKAWKNGKFDNPQTSYGLDIIDPDDVDYFQREWGTVAIELPDGTEACANIDKCSFFGKCPHLIDKTVKEWLRANGYIPWPSGKPHKFELELVTPNRGRFRLHDPNRISSASLTVTLASS